MILVTLAEAKRHLRIIDDADDPDLELRILAASEAVRNYLKDGVDAFTDSNGDLILDSAGDPVGVPFVVKAATLLMLGYLYKDRDENADDAYEQGFLPKPVTALLYPLRDPALA